MAFLFGDSFDLWGTASDAVLSGSIWDTFSLTPSSSITRFSYGKAAVTNNGGAGIKQNWTAGNSTNTVYFSVGLYQVTGSHAEAYLSLKDGSSFQVTIEWDLLNNQILVRTGGTAGTVIATFSSAGLASAIWHGWQGKIVIDGSVGEVHLRVDGAASDTFSATGLNTKTTANSYCNGIQVYGVGQSGGNVYWDDLYVCDSSGSYENTWPGDLRSWYLLPAGAGSNTQFASQPQNQSVVGTTSTSTAHAANELWVGAAWAASYTGTVTGVTLQLSAGFTGNVNVCLYDNTNSSNAGNVLATATAVNNPSAGNVTFTFSSPPSIVKGTSYRIGILTDASANFNGDASTGAEKKSSVTYGSFPTNPSGFTTSQHSPYCLVTITPSNWFNASEAAQDGDGTYNYDANVGDIDSYATGGLPSSPSSITHVQQRMLTCKSDAGARSAQTYLKSGSTVSLGAGAALATSYQYQFDQHSVDPNTSAPWEVGAINAAEIGVKVSA